MKPFNNLKRILFVLVQCTWGLGPTVMGLLYFLANIKCPHRWYRGAIETQWKNKYMGLSLGLFIFTPTNEQEYYSKCKVHEYGHCFQAILLGPFYIFVGIISTSWGMLPVFKKLREKKKIPYTACFVEGWASKWGELATGEEAVWD
ncbi:MAG: hypothetical protein K6A89_12490 [Treponema sp.]|nr:hypothetical protein [Treponema sp.]